MNLLQTADYESSNDGILTQLVENAVQYIRRACGALTFQLFEIKN